MKIAQKIDIAEIDGDTGGCRGIFWNPLTGIENPPASPLHTFGRYRKYGPARPEGKENKNLLSPDPSRTYTNYKIYNKIHAEGE
jgi:hypothetical protein